MNQHLEEKEAKFGLTHQQLSNLLGTRREFRREELRREKKVTTDTLVGSLFELAYLCGLNLRISKSTSFPSEDNSCSYDKYTIANTRFIR